MFNIIEKRKILFLIPCVIILAGIISFIIFGGLNTDIDFTGGTAMEIELGQKYDEALIRKTIDAHNFKADISLDDVLKADKWARMYAEDLVI